MSNDHYIQEPIVQMKQHVYTAYRGIKRAINLQKPKLF